MTLHLVDPGRAASSQDAQDASGSAGDRVRLTIVDEDHSTQIIDAFVEWLLKDLELHPEQWR